MKLNELISNEIDKIRKGRNFINFVKETILVGVQTEPESIHKIKNLIRINSKIRINGVFPGSEEFIVDISLDELSSGEIDTTTVLDKIEELILSNQFKFKDGYNNHTFNVENEIDKSISEIEISIPERWVEETIYSTEVDVNTSTPITKEWLNSHFDHEWNGTHGDYWIGYTDQAGHGCTITKAVELTEATYYVVDAPASADEYGKGYSTTNTLLCSTVEEVKKFLELCGDMSYLVSEL